ncbi:ABC transporter permease [Roseivirga misakiensis]|uniref:ABC3 transporter permease protein domain-containing protein n=1 Tax=Roseivirga misakiensis TaxID=1563681 RepID=A0A1E5T079_9BACT|nr:ABC transporter permease [Roseivirga misakiensis]OEK04769.1 hypothetical protein BFP71_15090 [Roseivirga misakiensis]
MKFFTNGVKSLKRNRLFTFVNVLGLSLGMFCFLVSSLYVRDELTHDKWHENSDRIYLPSLGREVANGFSYTSPPFAVHNALLNDIPGVETVVNLAEVVTESFSFLKTYEVKGETFDSRKIYAAEPTFFDVFDFDLKIGDEKNALNDPKDIIISAELAEKHFGKENPIGEFITLKDKGTYSVSGVLKPIPSNSHLRFDLIIYADLNAHPYSSYKGNWQLGWGKNYVLMRDNYSIEDLTKDLDEIYQRNQPFDEPMIVGFDLFSDLYLDGRANGRERPVFGGDRKYIYIFSIVGALLFLVACFNYVNLKIAGSFAQTKDMAIRKVLGASKAKLILLSIGETALVAIISLVIAIIAVELSLGDVNQILGKRLDLSFIKQPELLLLPFGALALVVLISGIYPALVSSSFNISSLLKGSLPNVNRSVVRKLIVGFQFVICAGLLSSAFIIRGQAKYMINKDIGYNTENVFSIGLYENGFGRRYEQLKSELERIPQISAVTGSSLPSSMMGMFLPVIKDGEETQALFRTSPVDLNFNEVMEVELIKGQTFADIPESRLENAAIINETAYKSVGIEDIIGKKIDRFEIIGVVKDFHVASVKSEISPVILTINKEEIRNLQFKFRAGEKDVVMAQLEQLWKDQNVQKPLKTTELATFYANAFKREATLLTIFNGLTAMLVIIAFLGLFTIATFESQFRERELSIRKVLGADYLSLLKLSNGRFLGLVLISLLLSIPVTYELISGWLEGFPYRVESLTTYFITSSAVVLFLAVFVLSLNGHKNAQKNPVDVLRNE